MQSRRNFGERVLSIFLTKIMINKIKIIPSLILMAAEGWSEKEICTKGAIKGHLENIEYSKYQLIVVTAEEVLSKPFLFLLKKTASQFHSSALRVFVFVGRQRFRFLI